MHKLQTTFASPKALRSALFSWWLGCYHVVRLHAWHLRWCRWCSRSCWVSADLGRSWQILAPCGRSWGCVDRTWCPLRYVLGCQISNLGLKVEMTQRNRLLSDSLLLWGQRIPDCTLAIGSLRHRNVGRSSANLDLKQASCPMRAFISGFPLPVQRSNRTAKGFETCWLLVAHEKHLKSLTMKGATLDSRSEPLALWHRKVMMNFLIAAWTEGVPWMLMVQIVHCGPAIFAGHWLLWLLHKLIVLPSQLTQGHHEWQLWQGWQTAEMLKQLQLWGLSLHQTSSKCI